MLSCLKRGPVFYKSLWAVTLPIILQNLVDFSLSMADTLMLGLVGERPMAAVALANTPFFVLMVMVFGFQSGASVLISQYWGKKDPRAISRVIGIAFMIAFSVSGLASLAAMLFPVPIMRLFSSDPETVAIAAQYFRAVALAYPINVFTQVYISAHRSMENSRVGLVIVSVAMVSNTFLNWVLIFGNLGAPAMGAVGAAVATVLSRVIQLAVTITYVHYSRVFRLDVREMFHPGKELTGDFIHYAMPVVCNETLWGIGYAAITAVYGRMGTSVVAAMSLCKNVENVFNVACFGLANSAVIFVGKALGAGDRDEADQIARALIWISLGIGVLFCGLLLLTAPFIIGLFPLSAATQALAQTVLIIYAFRLIPRHGASTCVMGALRGGGDTRMAAYIDLLPMWLWNIPVTALLGLALGLPPVMAFLPGLLEEFIRFYIGARRIKSGLWLRNVTRELV